MGTLPASSSVTKSFAAKRITTLPTRSASVRRCGSPLGWLNVRVPRPRHLMVEHQEAHIISRIHTFAPSGSLASANSASWTAAVVTS